MGFDPNNGQGGGWPPGNPPQTGWPPPTNSAQGSASGASPPGSFGEQASNASLVPVGSPFGLPPSPTSPSSVSDKDQATVFLLSLSGLLGIAGIDRFFLGQPGLGILKLLTAGGCGFWSLVDTVTIGMGKMRDAQGRPLRTEPTVGTPTRKQSVAFLLSCLGFFGISGIDRIYLGHTGLGIAKLLTGGLCGLWTLYDFVMIGTGKVRDAQGNSLLPE